jgi:hypothetical protein
MANPFEIAAAAAVIFFYLQQCNLREELGCSDLQYLQQ